MNRGQDKVLILVPSEDARGGISNYYRVISDKFTLPVKYFIRGSRTWPRRSQFLELLRSCKDLFLFIITLIKNHYSFVIINTSLGAFGIIRDAIFIIVSKLFRKEVIVFFRGWNLDYQNQMNHFLTILIKKIFFKAKAIIVLSNEIKVIVTSLGYRKNIYVETTVVNDDFTLDINQDTIINKYLHATCYRILYLSRIEKNKGIYEALQAFKIVNNNFINVVFAIAGDGHECDNVKEFVKNEQMNNVEFLGFISGEEKKKAFNDSHIFIFPSYTEGMPNSVLEAMAMGLPVLTTDVGGIKDFFINEKNGYLFKNSDPKDFAEGICNLLKDKNKMIHIGTNNYNLAKKKFIGSEVVKRLESIIKASND